ncbi:MAG: ABC transporter ATP-binding protein [Butyricicoccus sp.]
MVRDPAVFLLDEPLSNLDAKLRTQMRTEIIKLHQKLDTTFVYVTHDQTEAMTMGDRIVVMKGGEIQQADTPQTLYDHPCNLFVAGFIGSPQMNFMDAELGRDADGYKLTFADQSLLRAAMLSEYVGKTVVFGIRPRICTPAKKFTQNAAHTLTMHVDIAELMGAEIYAHCTCDGTSVTVRTPSGEPIHAGDTITAAVDMSRIHLFDKQTERAIAF